MDPNWALNHANLGALYRAAGDLSSAESSFHGATEKAPGAVLFHLNLGIVDEELGNVAQATESYNQVLSIQPDWAGSYFWRSNAFRQQILTTWNRDHLPPHEPSLEELQAARAANPNVAATALRLAERYLQLRQLDEAAKFLQEADLSFYERSEDRLEYLWLSADLAALEGNYPQAIQLAERSLDGWRNQGVNGPGSLGTYLYAQLMFRRPAMSMEMVPQLQAAPLTDRWGQRVLSLLDWLLKAGDMSKACTWFHFLNENVPDLQGLSERSINLGNCPIN
jgi:tetratricopeptide (TPR) repeat protein